MSTINRQSMNYLEASSPYFNSDSIRSYDSNCSLPYSASHSSSGQIYTNAAFEHSDSSGVSSSPSHDYEDLQSVRTEAKSIFGPRKKTNDVYQPTRSQRVRQITECSDISIASSASCDALPIKEETCLSKLILCLILAVSVAALVLVVLIVSGKLGPKCGCAQENNISAPSTGSGVSVQSLLSRIEDLEKKEKMVELLQAQVSAQKRLINETANKVGSLHLATNQLSTALGTTQSNLEKLNETVANNTKEFNTAKENLVNEDISIRTLINDINETLSIKVDNVSKMEGPIGPRGFNGSQGPSGLQGSQGLSGSQGSQGIIGPQGFNGSQGAQGLNGLQGPQGPKGAGDFSQCIHKTDSLKQSQTPDVTPSQTNFGVSVTEPNDKKIVGASCSSDKARQHLLSVISGPPLKYKCDCEGHYETGSVSVTCVLHYWECPLTT